MFKVSARTILELGSELISSDIIAFYELIKNGFDAKTKNGVEISFNVVLRRNDYLSVLARARRVDSTLDELKGIALSKLNSGAAGDLIERAEEIIRCSNNRNDFICDLGRAYKLNNIVIADSGSGMSADDLKRNFLTIGTASRKREVDRALREHQTTSPFLGEKGIGRLSAMRLGNGLSVETATVSDPRINLLTIDWSLFSDVEAMIDDIKLEPTRGAKKSDPGWSGTRIVVNDLSEDWTETRVRRMVDYDFARLTDPFIDQKRRPRIVIFWNGVRLSVPWMNSNLIEHAHARLSGKYTIRDGAPHFECTLEAVDLGFPHPKEVQVVTLTEHDLESVLIGATQEIHDEALTRVGPFSFEAHWYNRRRLTGIDGVGELKAVRELQHKWSGILLFRDKFRVFPYGDDEDDWLALDRKALGRSGYSLNKTQFIGRVSISRTDNPELIDQTNREGLRETPEEQVFLGVMQYAINNILLNFLRDVEKQYKSQKIDLTEAKSEIISLEGRASAAIKKLKKVIPNEDMETVEELEQALFDFKEFSEKARRRISEVEQESRQMVELAGVGMMVEVVAHELARVSENALENLAKLQRRSVPEDIKRNLESLRSEMKSLSKRVRILDPLSVSGRQRAEVFDLGDLINETLLAHEAQFGRHQIRPVFDPPKKNVTIRAVKGMIVQILENLISNSKYWLEMKKLREPSFTPQIFIGIHENPATIIFEDNGRGIAVENAESVFKAFFSLKEKSKRRGLGLFIARECASYNGASIFLSETPNPVTGRLHQFIIEFADTSSIR